MGKRHAFFLSICFGAFSFFSNTPEHLKYAKPIVPLQFADEKLGLLV
jgi:hypothetical protein